MPFVQRARDFLENQGSLTDHKNVNYMVETVRFLINNAVGLENAKSTEKILQYLKKSGLEINRSRWEIDILGELRDNGVFIGSHRTKGMYIINSENEAKKVYLGYKKRIFKEIERMEFLRAIMLNAGWRT